MKPALRKTHKKTRTGCTSCKRRKIKCDEQKPICENCVRHDISCEYTLTTATPRPDSTMGYGDNSPSNSPAPTTNPLLKTPPSLGTLLSTPTPSATIQNGLQTQALNLADLELLHQYTTSTSGTLSNNSTLKILWRVTVPELGFTHELVMRGVLATAALHLAHCRPRKKEYYISQAQFHNQIGLGIASSQLPHINEENCNALYIFTALTFLFCLASHRTSENLFLLQQTTDVMDWLKLFRGMRLLTDLSMETLQNGVLSPLFSIGMRRAALRAVNTDEQSQFEGHLGELQRRISETVTDPAMLKILSQVTTELRLSFQTMSNNGSEPLETADIFIWLFRLPEEYLLLLRERKQEPMAIFAHFCVITKRLESHWWISGWSSHCMSEIYHILDEEHKLWIRWPMEEIGWVPDNR